MHSYHDANGYSYLNYELNLPYTYISQFYHIQKLGTERTIEQNTVFEHIFMVL